MLEVTGDGIPGDPAAVEAAADTLRSAAADFTDTADAIGSHRRALSAEWIDVHELDRWPDLIGSMILVKQNLQEVDPHVGSLYGFTVPHLGASEEQLARLEQDLGEPLDPQLRELLSYIDGWEEFHIDDELLSTAQLGDAALRAHLRELVELTVEYLPLPAQEWLVFARSTSARTLMVIGRPGTEHAGQVIWLDGQEVGRYVDLRDWFLAMIELHRIGLREALSST